MKDRLIKGIRENWIKFYGEDPSQSKDLPRIVNEMHTNRLASLIEDSHGGKVICGGKINRDEKFIEPTIVDNPSL